MLFLSKSFVFYAISLLFWWISFTIKDAQRLDRCIGRIVHRSRSADNIRSLDAGKPTVVHPQVRVWTQSQPAATIGCSPKSADWSAALEKRLALLRSPNCEFQFRDSRDSRSLLRLSAFALVYRVPGRPLLRRFQFARLCVIAAEWEAQNG